MTDQMVLEFEQQRKPEPPDETDVSLRFYVAKIPAAKLAEYDPTWSDEQVMAWDGNFRSDGNLMLVCCERDVDAGMFRSAVEEFLRFKKSH